MGLHDPPHIPGQCPPFTTIEIAGLSGCQCPAAWWGTQPPPCPLHNPMTGYSTLSGVSTISAVPCEGCGFAYLTNTVNLLHPHDPAACAAYKRGYEAGRAAAERGEH
jgi:hypothetical protein